MLLTEAKVDAVIADTEAINANGKALEATSVGELDTSRTQMLLRYARAAVSLAALQGHNEGTRWPSEKAQQNGHWSQLPRLLQARGACCMPSLFWRNQAS